MTRQGIINGYRSMIEDEETEIARLIAQLEDPTLNAGKKFKICEWIADSFDSIASDLGAIERIELSWNELC